MRFITTIFWLLILIAAVIFAVLNSRTIEINFYSHTINFYFPLLLLILLVVGAILGIIATLPLLMRLKQKNRKDRQRLRIVEQELKNLRSIPVKDTH